ncbi:hypothetical protein J6590_024686 [Homalodisca vitripennis]|nr:hypothetical protein J6590_024686 [Homalodisca vitripennis]
MQRTDGSLYVLETAEEAKLSKQNQNPWTDRTRRQACTDCHRTETNTFPTDMTSTSEPRLGELPADTTTVSSDRDRSSISPQSTPRPTCVLARQRRSVTFTDVRGVNTVLLPGTALISRKVCPFDRHSHWLFSKRT